MDHTPDLSPKPATRDSDAGLTSADLPALPAGVRLVTLENGLTLIVREDHSAPVVSAQAWCRAGSIDEGAWLGAGLSHVLEHMLFKGTTRRGPGRIDLEVQEAGGYLNAYTSFDRTVFWINVPNTGTAVALDVLGDIMQNASLPEAELARELDVIRREMDMGHDDPGRRSSRRLFETAYTRSPYRYTVIGYLDVFDRLTRADIVGYYRERYAPNNLFFVVVGDLDADRVVAQIRDAFAPAKTRPLPPTVLPVEPRQMAPREMIEEAPIELGHVHWSWHVPDLRHPDVPLLDILALLLGSGRSSRLFQRVREQQALVTSIEAWTYNPGNPGLFGISATVEGPRFAEARDAVLAEVERIKREPVSAAECAKAVKQFVAATLSARKTMQGQAQDLGANWMAAGDLNFSERYLEAVRRATPADIRRVALEYLTTPNRTTYALLPPGMSPKPRATVESSLSLPIQKCELANGLRLLVKEDHRLPFIELRLVLRGGLLAETPADNGVTQLLARMLMQGTHRRTGEALSTEIESVGGSLDAYAGNNSFGVTVEVMQADLETGLDLLADVLLNPAFPADALERERQIQLAGIRALKDQLLQNAFHLMRRGLFGDTGYGMDALGTEATVRGFQSADLVRVHRRLVIPANAVLAIYGDVTLHALRDAVERMFANWQSDGAPLGDPTDPAIADPRPRTPRIEEFRDKKQAVVALGFPGTLLKHPDRHALDLLQETCSDLGSRLFLRIRERLGLAYYVGAQHFPGLAPGYFALYAGTAPEQAALVEQELRAEAEALVREGLTPEELARAKAKIVGQRKIARQDLGGYAMATALDELYGLGFANYDQEDARYEAVTLEDIRRVAVRYLDPACAVVAVLRPDTRAAT